MRIIAGSLKGRIFHDLPGHHAHPMSDKARGALFNVLGDIEGLSVLDAMAGSGALSFEAVSRGAKSAVAIELKSAIYKTLQKSLKQLDLGGQIKAINAEAGSWSSHNTKNQFDIVLLDPPYQQLQHDLLFKLVGHTKKDGIIVLSWPGREPLLTFDDTKQLMNKKYGDIQLVFYRKIK